MELWDHLSFTAGSYSSGDSQFSRLHQMKVRPHIFIWAPSPWHFFWQLLPWENRQNSFLDSQLSLSPIFLRRPQNIGLDERPRKKLKLPRHCDEVLSFEYVKPVHERKMKGVVRISGWRKITNKTNSGAVCRTVIQEILCKLWKSLSYNLTNAELKEFLR